MVSTAAGRVGSSITPCIGDGLRGSGLAAVFRGDGKGEGWRRGLGGVSDHTSRVRVNNGSDDRLYCAGDIMLEMTVLHVSQQVESQLMT